VLDFADDHAAIDVAAAEAFAAELRDADPDGPPPWWTRLGLRLSADDRRELEERLEQLVADLQHRDDPAGEPVSIYLALHHPGTDAARDRESA
jgi:hypothetical protein